MLIYQLCFIYIDIFLALFMEFFQLMFKLFSQVLGPKFMENRKPFELKQVLIWYNLFQVIFSCWLFHEVSLWCQCHFACCETVLRTIYLLTHSYLLPCHDSLYNHFAEYYERLVHHVQFPMPTC